MDNGYGFFFYYHWGLEYSLIRDVSDRRNGQGGLSARKIQLTLLPYRDMVAMCMCIKTGGSYYICRCRFCQKGGGILIGWLTIQLGGSRSAACSLLISEIALIPPDVNSDTRSA